jgi:hypothetical protein
MVELLTRQNATIMRPPIDTKVANRRDRVRHKLDNRVSISIEGRTGMIQDVGIGGARISTNYCARKGERIRMDVAGQPLFGHVLEVLPNVTRGYGNDLRVLFEQPISPKDLKKKFAPAG